MNKETEDVDSRVAFATEKSNLNKVYHFYSQII